MNNYTSCTIYMSLWQEVQVVSEINQASPSCVHRQVNTWYLHPCCFPEALTCMNYTAAKMVTHPLHSLWDVHRNIGYMVLAILLPAWQGISNMAAPAQQNILPQLGAILLNDGENNRILCLCLPNITCSIGLEIGIQTVNRLCPNFRFSTASRRVILKYMTGTDCNCCTCIQRHVSILNRLLQTV